ncbi:MAG: hypothetical protein H7Z40_09820 [Phycisphaerae bacterium]|nr:hypothetical protein [Gemmatimonadaceae bacterium]
MRKLLIGVTAGMLAGTTSASVAVAQGAAASTPAKQSVAGEWNASYNTPGGARAFRVLLLVDGEKLTGTVKREAGDSPLVGMVKGDSVTFTYAIKYGENTLAMTVAAKVTGDTMNGSVDFAGQAQEAFEAKKIAGPAKP